MGDASREYSLKVDNLPLHADKFQLREAFRAYGDVADVYIPRDRAYGFVRFRSQQDAEEAQEAMDGAEVCGKPVRVSFAKDKDKEKDKDRDVEGSRKRVIIGEPDEEVALPPPKRGRGSQGAHTFKCLGSENVVAALIGKGGNALRELQEDTGTRLDFSGRGVHFLDTRCRVITVRGESSEGVARVLDTIVDRIHEAAQSLDDEPSKGRFANDCRVVSLVARFVAGSLLGKGGEDMRRLQSELQCYIEVEKITDKTQTVEGHQRVEIRGSCEEVKRALRVVNDKVSAEVHRDWFPGWAAQDPLAGLVFGGGGSARGVDAGGRAAAEDAGRGRGRPRLLLEDAADGPSPEDLAAFRDRYPVDERAWQYFLSSGGPIKVKVMQDFRPKPLRDGDEDFSALLTSFVASVAKRFADNPSGFRKGLGGGGGGRDLDEEPPARGPRAPAGPPPEVERPPTRDSSVFTQTMNDIPLRYLGYDYAICCDLPVDRCKPIRRCMDEVGEATRTQIDLFGPEAEGTQRLHITGRLPDVYAAHLRLMWEFNASQEKPEVDPELSRMQSQIAELQAQLDAVRGAAGKRPERPERPVDRGGKGRNGRR